MADIQSESKAMPSSAFSNMVQTILKATMFVGAMTLYFAAFQKLRGLGDLPSGQSYWGTITLAACEIILGGLFIVPKLSLRRVACFTCLWIAFAAYHVTALSNGSLQCPCFGSLKVAHSSLLVLSTCLAAITGFGSLFVLCHFRNVPQTPCQDVVSQLGVSVTLSVILGAVASAFPQHTTPLALSLSRSTPQTASAPAEPPTYLEIANTGRSEVVVWGVRTSCGIRFDEPFPQVILPHENCRLKTALRANVTTSDLFNVRIFFSVDDAGLDVADVKLQLAQQQ